MPSENEEGGSEPGFEIVEPKFVKSRLNRRTENSGLSLLLSDGRFQAAGPAVRLLALRLLGVGQFGPRAFDAFMTSPGADPLTALNLPSQLASLRLIEMKTTRRSISDERLHNYFFGATEREFELAAAIPEHHRWAFVVLSSDNRFGRPYFVILTHAQLLERIRSQRTQFQVTLGWDENGTPGHEAIGPQPPDQGSTI